MLSKSQNICVQQTEIFNSKVVCEPQQFDHVTDPSDWSSAMRRSIPVLGRVPGLDIGLVNHRLRLVKSELETGLIFGTGSRTGTEMCLLEESILVLGRYLVSRVTIVHSCYKNPTWYLEPILEEMYLFEEVNEVPPKFNFFLLNERKKGLAHHSKKWNYGGSPK
jgi:hypothetical protein